METKLIDKIFALESKMIERRRKIHSCPELSGNEAQTMEFVCAELEKMGVSYQKNIGGYGVLATLNGKRDGKTVALRADMDALPVQEETGLPFASKYTNVMHACGHDAHTAILLTVCEVLSGCTEQFDGTIKFIFQPLEETTGGAEPMIQAGILENPPVDACVALHVDPELDSGLLRVKEGANYASPDDFEIIISGKSGHGAQPQLCVDPILTAAHIIVALQSVVSRRMDPFDSAVVTVGSVHGGSCSNAIPDIVKIVGTARAASEEIRDLLCREIGRIAQGICDAMGAQCEYKFIRLFPPLVNDSRIAKMVYEAIRDALGEEHAVWGGAATMAGEDFAYFTQKVPSAIFKLGCRNEEKGITAPLHNAKFTVDESCMKYGAAALANFALRFLKQKS